MFFNLFFLKLIFFSGNGGLRIKKNGLGIVLFVYFYFDLKDFFLFIFIDEFNF